MKIAEISINNMKHYRYCPPLQIFELRPSVCTKVKKKEHFPILKVCLIWQIIPGESLYYELTLDKQNIFYFILKP